ncbi:DUF1294 domain-containing protein [Pseudomonas sp. CFBP 13727]|uniref:DUF1294 domain-containing protein n=1 Tax=Pseudomonas sp. CFBP 13727 TaxID=2775295 RepID=UPI00406C8269
MRRAEPASRRAPSPLRGGQQRPVRFLALKLTAFILLCLLPFLGVLRLVLAGHPVLLAVYALMSLLAVGLYWHDKRRATVQGQRIPERLLHGVELLGGWPGALLAQQLFRHKTRKVSYQLVFWLIVALHQAFWFDQVIFAGQHLGITF